MEQHITVLKRESIDALDIKPGSTIIDATFGSGGHAEEIIPLLGRRGTFVGLDADKDAIENAKIPKGEGPKIHLVIGNFRTVDSIVDALNIDSVEGILADLGWRMEQFSGNGRGFSFSIDEPLLMTFGDPKDYVFTAKDIVNEWEEENIKNVLKGYGEERFSGRIAKAILEARSKKPITTSVQLRDIIVSAVPKFYQKGKVHPATRSFQALRIAVNDELKALEEFIEKSIQLLKPGGRLAIISFHSLEDRIVKHAFRKLSHDHRATIITKRPIVAQQEELKRNPRSRSAKLRILEKNETP